MSIRLPVDHLVALVPSLERARAAFAESGFTLTPTACHSEAMGTANSCIMLPGAYVELMGIVAPTPANEGWRTLLRAGPGLRGIALRSGDVARTAAMLARRGIDAEPARTFSRPMAEGELRFSVIRLPRASTPGLQCLFCQHHTPALVWTQGAMAHANGASRILSAAFPGSTALTHLASEEAGDVAVADEPEGRITIEMRQSLSSEHKAAIAREAGIHIDESLIP
ncbi:VOC family protein [Aureimonas populi]|uniref:VOC family protein n=1 Tax=Aureimonas populi TaxID=1701758 RepID=A0ABW5CL33_9HYPH|nr:VOC family protein [Aureimonas populi]